MKFLDINTFFCPSGGGIRIYHQAKVDYFLRHTEDMYTLIYPGHLNNTVEEVAPNIRLIQVYGTPLSRDPKGYRMLLNYPSVLRAVRKFKPHVIEAGDPWLTGLFCLYAPFAKGTVRSSFYHTDPMDTYVRRWADIKGGAVRIKLRDWAGRLFYSLQKKYDATFVSSGVMQKKLNGRGIRNTVLTPFGVDPIFLNQYSEKAPGEGEEKAVRILYLGRLDREKGVELLLEIMPKLLENPDLSISVGGRGTLETGFRAIRHPRYRFLGFIAPRWQAAELYARHHIFLAPGPYETFGLSGLEAMAAGLVVVGPDRGGTGELLKEMDSPYIFEAGNADHFYRTLMSAVLSDQAAEGRKAHQFASQFGSWHDAIGRMVSHYKQMVREEGR